MAQRMALIQDQIGTSGRGATRQERGEKSFRRERCLIHGVRRCDVSQPNQVQHRRLRAAALAKSLHLVIVASVKLTTSLAGICVLYGTANLVKNSGGPNYRYWRVR